MRTEIEILDKLCTIEKQINMYLKHYDTYRNLIQKAGKPFRDIFHKKRKRYRRKCKQIETYMIMLIGMKNELLWVFQRP